MLTLFLQSLPVVVFFLLLLLQWRFPRRATAKQWQRWVQNFLLFAINFLILRLVVPIGLVTVSMGAADISWGFFNWISIPPVFELLFAILVLDVAIYWQHVATHKFSFLWRIHRVHHADIEMDTTTAIRFHPVELLFSLAYKALIVIVLGASVEAVLIFELLLFIGPAFNHSNLRLSASLDRILRWIIVTPDVHRCHHSTHLDEQNSNYGFCFIWWDRLFGSYLHQPREGHTAMCIGLDEENIRPEDPWQPLLMPLRD